MSLDLSTPDAVRGAILSLAEKVNVNSTQVADLTNAVQGALAGGGVQSAGGGGLDAFRGADGKLALVPAVTDAAVEVDGKPALLRIERAGILAKSAAHLLPEAERRAVADFRGSIGKLATLARGGYRGGLAPLSREIGAADAVVKSAPASVRDSLRGALSGVLGTLSARAEGTLASSTAAASGPFLDWVAEEYMADYLDTTPTEMQAGLANILLRTESSGSLHRTEALKVRLLTGIGGIRRVGVQSSDVVGEYPVTNVSVTTASVTGARGVHSALIDAVDLVDPRVAFDALALHQRAALMVERATDDLIFLHGEEESTVAAHVYGAAGLAAIGRGATLDIDGREVSESATLTDMLLTADGLLGMASDQSNDLDDATFGMASETEWLTDVAGFLKFHALAMPRIREQYQNLPSTGYVLGFAAARKLQQLNLLTAGGQMLLTPVTDAGNPWLIGRLFDGTPVFRHAYVGSGAYNTSGVPASGGKDVAFLAATSAIMLLRGPGHGSVKVEARPGSDAVQISRTYYSRPFNPIPNTQKTVLRVFGLDV